MKREPVEIDGVRWEALAPVADHIRWLRSRVAELDREPRPDLSADRSYLAGLNRGYALGVNGDEQGLQETQESYRREIHNHTHPAE